jgi:transcriptional regulator with XRE-family HTH domain
MGPMSTPTPPVDPPAPAGPGPTPVGRLLRDWRTARGLSQLDLALRAGFSTRHVSFIETGRSQPSRQALLVLAETLEVPLRERNVWLEAGGFADAYRETPLDAETMAPIRSMLRFILDRHTPYAAIVLDRYSTCLMGNAAADRLVALTVDPSIVTPAANHLRLAFHPLGARRSIVNWEQVGRHLLARAERELAGPGDPQAAALLAELRDYAGPQPRPAPPLAGDLLLPIHIRRGDVELRLFSAIMTLGTPRDVTLQELRIETFFPADAASDAAWRQLCAGDAGEPPTSGPAARAPAS